MDVERAMFVSCLNFVVDSSQEDLMCSSGIPMFSVELR